ncbi:guanylate kinase [Planctomycetota bacterium]
MNEQRKNKGKLVIVSGPSGVGKGTICKEVIKRLDDVCISVSVTTRVPADGEVDGVDYWFVSAEKFQEYIDNGSLLEYADVFGNMYGTPKGKVDEVLSKGKTVILEIDVQGAKQVKVLYHDAKMIFILPPTHKDLAKRLNHRGRETPEVVEKRINHADDEIAVGWQYYDRMVINEDLEQAVNEVVEIIQN